MKIGFKLDGGLFVKSQKIWETYAERSSYSLATRASFIVEAEGRSTAILDSREFTGNTAFQ